MRRYRPGSINMNRSGKGEESSSAEMRRNSWGRGEKNKQEEAT